MSVEDFESEFDWLPIEKLYPHPDNPRLIYREDIIDTIAQSVTEKGFSPEYALLVRPFGDGYQIISGHTRHKAAINANCQMLPCWVKEMGDGAAFLELKLANNQGELSFLEEGKHTLAALEKYELPLKTYIKRIGGKDSDRVKATQRMQAFKVFVSEKRE
jgi:ParB family chromosome partitioning protein